jgi:tetratricopeptide (TPR) repeat protein
MTTTFPVPTSFPGENMVETTLQSLYKFAVPVLFLFCLSVSADDRLDGLIKDGKFKKAVEYIEKSIPPAQRNVETWLHYADALEKSGGDKQKIAKAFVEAQKVQPSDPHIFAAMGEYYLRNKDYREAIKHLQKWYLLSRNARAAEAMSTCALNLKQFDKARDAAESAVMLDSNSIEARKVLSFIYFNEKDWAGAAQQLEAIVAKNKDDAMYWKKLAHCYEELGNREKLALAAAQIVALDSKDTRSRSIMIDYYLEKKNRAAALPLLKELAVLTPNDAKTFKNLYLISIESNQKKDAILYLRNYLIIDSTDANAYKTLGDLLLEQKNSTEALDAYRKACRLNPSITGLYRNYLSIILEKKLNDEVIAVMPKAIAAGEVDASTYAAVGTILKDKKQCSKAIGYFQSALKIDMKNLSVLSSLAECQAATGKTAEALLNYQQVVMLNPAAKTEYKELGKLLAAQNKPDEAIANYRKYLEKSPDDESVASIVGLYFYNKKQYTKALPYFDKIKSSKLLTLSLLMKIGDCHFQNNNYPKTIEYLTKARSMNPKLPQLKELLKPLAIAYEKTGALADAAKTYEAYVKLPGITDAEASYKQAALREETDRSAAITLYLANTKTFPNDARNFTRLGILLSNEKAQAAKAIEYLQKAATLSPDDTLVLEKLCDIYHAAGNQTKELATALKLTALQPGNLTAHRRAGTIQYKKKQYTQAVPHLEKVFAGTPKDTAIVLMLADAYAKSKEPAKAMNLFSKAVELQPDNVAAWLSLVAAAEAAGNNNKAAEYKKGLSALDRKIVAKDPKAVDARMRLAEYLYEKNDLDGSLPVYKELAVLVPKDTLVVSRLLEISRKKGNSADALAYLKKYTLLNPKDAKAHVELGTMYYDQKNIDDALTEYRTALKLDSSLTGFFRNYANIVITKKLEDEAIVVLNLAIKKNETEAEMYPALAGIYQKKKLYPQAIAMYKKASTDNPKNLELLAALGNCQAANKDISAAILSFEQLVLLNPQATGEFKTLGSLQMQQNKKDDGIKSYRKYLEKNKEDQDVAKTVGLYLYKQNKFQDAIMYLEMVKNDSLFDREFLLALGESYYHVQDCAKLCPVFSRLYTKKAPASLLVKILRPLGECYEKTNNPKKAADAYAAYTSLSGVKDADASYLRAFLIEKSDPKTAETFYRANIKSFPKDSRNFVRLGMMYAGNPATLAKAAELLSQASVLNPKNVTVLLKLATVWNSLKNFTKELDTYKKLLLLEPQNIEVNKRAGSLFIENKMYQKAVECLEIVNVSSPGNSEIMLMLADAYLKTNRKDNAIKLLSEVQKVQKQNTDLMMQMYTIYREIGKNSEAEAMIRQLIALKNDNKYRIMLANDLLDQKRYEEVTIVSREVIKTEPMNLEGLMLLGKAQGFLKKYDDAAETFKMASYVKEDYAPAYYERGEIYRKQKIYDRAEYYFNKALRLDPKYGLAELGLARCAKAQNKPGDYLDHVNKAKKLDPENPEILAEEKEITPKAPKK